MERAFASPAMEHVTLYRKYRSRSFDELAGQDHVTRTLRNAIERGRIGHAYLFCGPRGTGKTTTARLLAKAVNCEQGPTADPCNECSICRSINNGSCLDVKEIDAASNRKIEDIRNLREDVHFAPAQARYKVYIVDEVHQVTGDAFNAFLKTLEEPPAHVIFVLATTEVQKLPATITSRCQRFDFRRASLDQLIQRVREVAAAEEIPVDDAALDLIARAADGSWRDALSILEQVLAYADERVAAEDVYQALGIVETQALHDIAQLALVGDGAGMFGQMEELLDGGKDPQQLLHDLSGHYRSLMLTAAGARAGVDPEWQQAVAQQAKAYGIQRLVESIEVLAQAGRESRWSEQPRLLLELAAVRLLHPTATLRAEPAAAATRPVAVTPAVPAPGSAAVAETPVETVVASKPADAKQDHSELELAATPVTPVSAEPAAARPAPPAPAPAEYSQDAAPVDRVRNRWRVIGQELKRSRMAPLEAVLRDAVPERMEGDELMVRFPYSTMVEAYERRKPEEKERLTELIEQLAGLRCRVRGIGPDSPGRPSETDRPTEAAGQPPQSAAASGGGAPVAETEKREEELSSAKAEPSPEPDAETAAPSEAAGGRPGLVHDVMDLFDGELVTDKGD